MRCISPPESVDASRFNARYPSPTSVKNVKRFVSSAKGPAATASRSGENVSDLKQTSTSFKLMRDTSAMLTFTSPSPKYTSSTSRR